MFTKKTKKLSNTRNGKRGTQLECCLTTKTFIRVYAECMHIENQKINQEVSNKANDKLQKLILNKPQRSKKADKITRDTVSRHTLSIMIYYCTDILYHIRLVILG